MLYDSTQQCGATLLQVSQKLRSNVRAVGDSTIDLLHCGVNAQIAPDDNQSIKDLNYASKVLAEKVLSVCLSVRVLTCYMLL